MGAASPPTARPCAADQRKILANNTKHHAVAPDEPLYTRRLMSYHPHHATLTAAPMGCMVLAACTQAMGARMMTTMTTTVP